MFPSNSKKQTCDVAVSTDPISRSLGIQCENESLLYDDMNKRMALIEFSQHDHSKFFKILQSVIDELSHRFELETPCDQNKENIELNIKKEGQLCSSPSTTIENKKLANVNLTNQSEYLIRKSKRTPKPKIYLDDGVDDQPIHKKKFKKSGDKINQSYAELFADSETQIVLGPYGTQISKIEFALINWDSASAATRKLLSLIFSNEILATHSLTGRPSPAFFGRERPPKNQLDPKKISDIINIIMTKTNATEREIRAAITTKCADTTKKFKTSGLRKKNDFRFSI